MKFKSYIFALVAMMLTLTSVQAQDMDENTAYYEQLGLITALTANPDRADVGIRLAASYIFSSDEVAKITGLPYERPNSLFHNTGLQPPDEVSIEVAELLKRLGHEVSPLSRSAFAPLDTGSHRGGREAMRSARDIMLAVGYTLNSENVMISPDGTTPAFFEVLTKDDQYQNELYHFVERFQRIGVRVIVSRSSATEFAARRRDRDYSFLISSFPQLRTANGFSDFLENNGKEGLAQAIRDAKNIQELAVTSRAAEHSLVMSNYEMIPVLFIARDGGISAERAQAHNADFFARLAAISNPARFDDAKEDITLEQTALKFLGLYEGNIDGKRGPRSQSAMANFEKIYRRISFGRVSFFHTQRDLSTAATTIAAACNFDNETLEASEFPLSLSEYEEICERFALTRLDIEHNFLPSEFASSVSNAPLRDLSECGLNMSEEDFQNLFLITASRVRLSDIHKAGTMFESSFRSALYNDAFEQTPCQLLRKANTPDELKKISFGVFFLAHSNSKNLINITR